MRMGIGLGAVPAFGLLLNLARVPIDWRIFLFIGAMPILILTGKFFRRGANFYGMFKDFKVNTYQLIAFVLFFISLYMYAQGAFAYPYLEDDDSWSHALGVKYVSIEKTVFAGIKSPFHYIDPYPPTYDMLLGIMHQTNNSVYWTIKFFNALIVSLSIIFFYFFVKVFAGSHRKALFSTFALFAVPAFLSHFIWAISLTMPLFFVSFYAVEKIRDDKKWWVIAAIVIVTAITSSPTHSTYFGLFFILYLAARTFIERKFLIYEFLAGSSALLLSFILWWLPVIIRFGFSGFLQGLGITAIRGFGNIRGTGDRIYTLSDFIFAKEVNMINNPIGIGIILSLLTILGLIFLVLKYKDMLNKENHYKLITLLWFFLAFYAVNAVRFPIKLSPFRAWMLLAIPVSLLSGEAINLIDSLVKSAVKNFTKSTRIMPTAISLAVLGLVAYGIITTSFIQKYSVNTALWGPGGFWTFNEKGQSEELGGYIWFKDNVPSEAKVFTFSNNALVIGLDKFICHWCSDVIDYQHNGFNQTIEQNYNWLKQGQYKYIIIDGQAVRKFGINETNSKIQSYINFSKFRRIFSNNGMIIFEIL